jgi:hypothetical protein
MSINHPLKPEYDGELSMVIRAATLPPQNTILHLYRYWKQHVRTSDKIKVEFSYQLDRAFLQQLRPLNSEPIFPDIALKVDNMVFNIHKCVMATSSPYFKALFLNEHTSPIITLHDVDSSAFAKLIQLIY